MCYFWEVKNIILPQGMSLWCLNHHIIFVDVSDIHKMSIDLCLADNSIEVSSKDFSPIISVYRGGCAVDADTFLKCARSRLTVPQMEFLESMIKPTEEPKTQEFKSSNPKDITTSDRIPYHVVPPVVIAHIAVAIGEGSCKYGSYNYRKDGVLASVYNNACEGHMKQWFEGEDIDPDSGLNHVIKAIASLVVLADAIIRGTLNDDRPPATKGWNAPLRAKMLEIRRKHASVKPTHRTQTGDSGGVDL